jgi:hypothetical protein
VLVAEASPAATPPPERSPTCSALLTVKQVDADSSSCVIDTRVRDNAGELVYPCEGGEANARFFQAHFRGSVTAGVVDVALSTTFDFEDGCRWISEQHITGPVSATTLEYRYTEAPAPGQSGCAPACTARASVGVARRRGAMIPSPGTP